MSTPNNQTTKYVYWKREKKTDSWKLADVEDIPSLIEEKGAMFTTWASFDRPPMDNEREDLQTYSVVRYGDLPLDFDSRGDIEKARASLVRVIDKLVKDYNVNTEELDIYVSGGKGFHLVIDRRIVGSEKGDKFLPLIYKSMVGEMFPEGEDIFSCIDRSLYCMKRGKMFRLPNVRREENGRYKVPVSYQELKTLDIEDLMALSEGPRLDFKRPVATATPSVGLMALFFQMGRNVSELISKQKRIPERMPVLKNGGILPCTKLILDLERKIGDMSFNEMCFSAIVPSLREAGVDHEYMLSNPDVEKFISNFMDSESYTTHSERYNHMKSVIQRDKTTPAGFSCGSMRKCLGGNNEPCVKCPYLIKSFFFDAFNDRTLVEEVDENTGMPTEDAVLDENPTLDQLLHEFVWTRIGPKEVIIRVTPNSCEAGGEAQMLSKSTFESLVNNRPLIPRIGPDGKIKYDRPSDAWLKSPKRKTFLGGVKFDPKNNHDETFYNTWRGFPIEVADMTVEEAAERCKLFRYHVEQVLCRGDKEHYLFLWAWLSDMIKNPGGKKPGSAVVLKGGKGTGKSTLAYPFRKILGRYCATMANAAHVFSRFNGHLEDKLLVVLEEAVWGGSHEADSALKSMITESTMTIEHKGFQAYQAETYMRVMMCSNEDWVVPASADERRFFVIDTGLDKRDERYFNRLYYEMDNGGAEALFVWLSKERFPEINLFNPPKTVGLDDQKLVGLDSIGEWWFGVLQSGYFTGGSSWSVRVDWKELITSKELYSYYVDWCRHTNKRFVESQNLVSRKVVGKSGLCPSLRSTVRGDNGSYNAYRVGSLERARKSFCDVLGLSSSVEWDTGSDDSPAIDVFDV